MKDVFLFESMLTPKIITLVYWVLLLMALASGLRAMFSEYGGGFIIGLGTIIGGVVGVRILCELLIVLFKINDNLKIMANKPE